MAKRNIVESGGELEEIENWYEDIEVEEMPIEYVTLVLMKALKMNCIGAITGNRYTFDGAGSQVAVDKRDVDEMLMKKSNLPCCSGGAQTPYFNILKG
jgi:hypothetical protein